MIVKEVMSHEVTTCSPDTTLEAAALLMWNGDCGTVAVVNDEGRVVGIITDRDICMAVALQHKPASEIEVQQVMARHLFTCQPESDIMNALKTMSYQQVRRLPVTNDSGHVAGIISIEDIIACAERGRRGLRAPALSYDDTMTTLKAICRPHKPEGVAMGTA
jgi:CBS domain-containing protein